ncbi:MAG: cell division protein SepF [archaeon]
MVMKRIKEFFSKVSHGGKNPDQQKAQPEKREAPALVRIDVKNVEKEPLALQVVKLQNFSDTEGILDSLRGGKRILLVKISGLKEKDMTELKRAINRFKTHCAATGADLAAIDESWIILVPPVVGLERV